MRKDIKKGTGHSGKFRGVGGSIGPNVERAKKCFRQKNKLFESIAGTWSKGKWLHALTEIEMVAKCMQFPVYNPVGGIALAADFHKVLACRIKLQQYACGILSFHKS